MRETLSVDVEKCSHSHCCQFSDGNQTNGGLVYALEQRSWTQVSECSMSQTRRCNVHQRAWTLLREGVDRMCHRARLSKEPFISNNLELFWSKPRMVVDFVRQEYSDFTRVPEGFTDLASLFLWFSFCADKIWSKQSSSWERDECSKLCFFASSFFFFEGPWLFQSRFRIRLAKLRSPSVRRRWGGGLW